MPNRIVGTEACSFLDVSRIFKSVNKAFPLTLQRLVDLANALNVNGGETELASQQVFIKMRSLDTMLNTILELWHSKQSYNATLNVLAAALRSKEMDALADALGKEYKISNLGKPTNSVADSNLRVETHPPPLSEEGRGDGTPNSGEGNQASVPPGLTDFSQLRIPLVVDVIPPKAPMKEGDDFYKLPVADKGCALILNIMSWQHYPNGKRYGSENDVNYMSNLCTQLGYEVYPRRVEMLKEQKTKEQVKELIQRFKKECELNEAKSVVIFIGSHGLHNKILTSEYPLNSKRGDDTGKLDLHEDILSEFTSSACPWLEDTPKIFFVQTCKDFEPKDELVPPPPTATDLPLPIKHAILMEAQFPGFGSHRNPLVGSWFAYILTDVLMRNSCKMDLHSMLRLARDKLEKATAITDIGQQSPIHDYGLKTLFFNLKHS